MASPVVIDIWTLWNDLKSNINSQQGGHLKLRDFNSWVNQISLELFKEKFAAWEKNQMLSDDLHPFLYSTPFSTTATALNFAILPYPKDYAFFSSARMYVNPEGKVVKCPEINETAKSVFAELCEVPLSKVDNARWGSVCSNKIIPPTLSRAFITQYSEGFKVAPKEIGFISLDYLHYPAKSRLAFQPGINQIYDPINTIPMQWTDTVRNEFLARLEKQYYKFIREKFGYATAQEKTDTTA